MGKETGSVIAEETVSIPLEVARDLIVALSAENARRREETKEAQGWADFYKGEAKKYESLWNIEIRNARIKRERERARVKKVQAEKKGE